MASHSFSSLKDMLKSSSSSSSSSSTPQAEANQPIEEINETNLEAMFDNHLSVKDQSCSSVSFLDSFTPPVLSSSSLADLSAVNPIEENPVEQIISSCGKNHPVVSSKELNKYSNGRSWCVKPGGPWTSRNVFPPPITCLKSIKNGKPYAYMKFNEDDQSFVLEEIKIPNKDFMRASRSDGHLKLYFVVSDDEASEMEEEIERADHSDDEQDSI